MDKDSIILLMAFIQKLKSQYKIVECYKMENDKKIVWYELHDLLDGKIYASYNLEDIENFQKDLGLSHNN